MLYKLDTNAKDYTKVNRVTLSTFGWKELDLQELEQKDNLRTGLLWLIPAHLEMGGLLKFLGIIIREQNLQLLGLIRKRLKNG